MDTGVCAGMYWIWITNGYILYVRVRASMQSSVLVRSISVQHDDLKLNDSIPNESLPRTKYHRDPSDADI